MKEVTIREVAGGYILTKADRESGRPVIEQVVLNPSTLASTVKEFFTPDSGSGT